MKSTLDLSDTLFTTIKITVATEGISMKEFITQAIEMRLKSKPAIEAKPWQKAFGGLQDLHKESRKLDKIITEEFGKVNPEDWK